MKWPSREVRDYFFGHADDFMQEAKRLRPKGHAAWYRFMKPREIFYKGRHLVSVMVRASTLGRDALAEKLFAMCCEGIPKTNPQRRNT